jgi:GNAT superfamily N-acetyltransferase
MEGRPPEKLALGRSVAQRVSRWRQSATKQPSATARLDQSPVAGPSEINMAGSRKEGAPYAMEPCDASAVALASLWRGVLDDGSPVDGLPGTDFASLRRRVDEQLKQVARRQLVVLGLDLDRHLVGSVAAIPGPGPLIQHRVELRRLMVERAYRRQGIGRRLLRAAVDQSLLLGRPKLQAIVAEESDARELFLGEGWLEVGRRRSTVKLAYGKYQDEIMFQFDA